jgi:Tetratricopeptide repeat
MTRSKTDADMALELARIAQLFLSYGKHAAADKLLNAALELEPNNPAINRVRAFTAYKCGRFAEAAALARDVRTAEMRSSEISARSASPANITSNITSNITGASPTAAGLAAMGLALVEAFSLMSLGRTGEADQRYASLDGLVNPPKDDI